VVDQTGLTGAFDFKLDWTPAPRTAAAPADPLPGLNIFEAVETQLGLKLESRKLPLPVIVIESCGPRPHRQLARYNRSSLMALPAGDRIGLLRKKYDSVADLPGVGRIAAASARAPDVSSRSVCEAHHVSRQRRR
jgi:Protein of unknown function (DUF3738)